MASDFHLVRPRRLERPACGLGNRKNTIGNNLAMSGVVGITMFAEFYNLCKSVKTGQYF